LGRLVTAAAPVFDPTWPLVRVRELEELIEVRAFGADEVRELARLRVIIAHEEIKDDR
jgi:hypothetical protein